MRSILITLIALAMLVAFSSAMDFFGGRGFNPGAGQRGMDGGNSMGSDSEYYDILGVDRKANENEIKKAFRKQVSCFYMLYLIALCHSILLALCSMPYAICPMPYALCPMPYAICHIAVFCCNVAMLHPVAATI
jgi:hypothetical protein